MPTFRSITEPAPRWTWWVYPSDLEIRNNGERYSLTGQQVAPRLTLPPNWTLGDVVNAVLKHNAKLTSPPIDGLSDEEDL